VENGTEFTWQFGDINEAFYNSLESMLIELTELLLSRGSDLYPRFRERVQRLTAHADQIGWGYGDALWDYTGLLEDKLTAGAGSSHASQSQPGPDKGGD
jgi:hypothetical protein